MKLIASNIITGVLVGLGVTQMQDGKFDKLVVNELIVQDILLKIPGDDNTVMTISPSKLTCVSEAGSIFLNTENPHISIRTENTVIKLKAGSSEASLSLSNTASETNVSLAAEDEGTWITSKAGKMNCSVVCSDDRAGVVVLENGSMKFVRLWGTHGLTELP